MRWSVPDKKSWGPSCPKTWDCIIRKTASIQLVIQLIRGWSMQGLWVTTIGHRPPQWPHCLPSCITDIMHITLSPRPSSSIFAYCKRSKTGAENGLGMRLVYHCYICVVCLRNFLFVYECMVILALQWLLYYSICTIQMYCLISCFVLKYLATRIMGTRIVYSQTQHHNVMSLMEQWHCQQWLLKALFMHSRAVFVA